MSSLDRYHLVPQHFRCHCCFKSNPLAVEYSWNPTTTTTPKKVMIWLNRCCKTLSPVSAHLVCVDLCSKKKTLPTRQAYSGGIISGKQEVWQSCRSYTLCLFSLFFCFSLLLSSLPGQESICFQAVYLLIQFSLSEKQPQEVSLNGQRKTLEACVHLESWEVDYILLPEGRGLKSTYTNSYVTV